MLVLGSSPARKISSPGIVTLSSMRARPVQEPINHDVDVVVATRSATKKSPAQGRRGLY